VIGSDADAGALREEFDAALRRAGIVVPPERYLGTLDNYAEMRRLANLVHRSFAPEDEPAATFSVRMAMPSADAAP
jgi:hypothetical protein